MVCCDGDYVHPSQQSLSYKNTRSIFRCNTNATWIILWKQGQKLKNTIKTVMLNLTANVALATAKKACGAASWFDCYQPKMPAKLRTYVKVVDLAKKQ